MGRVENLKPALAMIGLQFMYAGVALSTRVAMVKGLNPRVFVVYRQGIATLLISPIAFVSRRKNASPYPLGLRGFAWILLASFFGVTGNQNAYFEGLYLSSSTVASAMVNLIPGVTFLMTAILGLEKVHIRSMSSLAKVLGTVICVGGAISMALLKGPKLLNSELQLLPPMSNLSTPAPGGGDNDWLLGCLLLLGSSVLWSLWMVLQVPISASCPDHLYTSSWMCFFATIESATVAFLSGNRLEAWRLNSYLELSCCLYTGIALAVSFFVQAWCISKRGPLYCAMFNPLCTVIVTIYASIFQHEETYTGSLLGALAVIIGLYIVLWGKAKDLQEIQQGTDPKLTLTNIIDQFSDDKTCKIDLEEPLLSNKSIKDDHKII